MNDQRRPGTRNLGSGSSRSPRHATEIPPPAQRTERMNDTRTTTSHEVIRRWAEQRGARPATLPGSEYDGRLGVLRFDFPGYGGAVLRTVDWDEWFATFDARRLHFRYQEQRPDGTPSNFNRLEHPDR